MSSTSLMVYVGIKAPRLFADHTTAVLNRELLAPDDATVSQRHAPEVRHERGHWFLHNRYPVGQPRNLTTVDPQGRFYRLPAGAAIPLPTGETQVMVANHMVLLVVDGSVDAHDQMAAFTTAVAEDIATVVAGTTHAHGDATPQQTAREITDYLETHPDYWLSVAIRFQQFIDARNASPRPLRATEVTQCEPRIEEGTVHNVQRQLKKLTGLDADVELGNWLTYYGVLLDKHRDRIPHKQCAHGRRR